MIKIDTYNSCPKCKGTGVARTQKGIEDPCLMCNGLGGFKSGFIDITVIMNELKGQEGNQDD